MRMKYGTMTQTHQFRQGLIHQENGMGILQFVCWIRAKFEGITHLSSAFNLFLELYVD